MENNTQAKPEKKIDFKGITQTLISVCFGMLAGLLIHNFVISTVLVSGSSMEPTYYDSQFLLLNRLTGYFGDYDRNDVVVVDISETEIHKDDVENYYIIKRVIGTPGDKIYINGYGDIYINDEILDEENKYDTILNPGIASTEIKLHEDEYFVLGDNRNNSLDSRSTYIGVINKKDILGKIISK